MAAASGDSVTGGSLQRKAVAGEPPPRGLPHTTSTLRRRENDLPCPKAGSGQCPLDLTRAQPLGSIFFNSKSWERLLQHSAGPFSWVNL